MMRSKPSMLLIGLVALAAFAMMGCEGGQGPAGPAGPAGTLDNTCAQCHDSGNLITGKLADWNQSKHGTGEAFARGESGTCSGCHSGGAFVNMLAAGANASDYGVGDLQSTRQDCRTCHTLHTTYTEEDWVLRTTAAVDLFAIENATFDRGLGNLCVNCHQPRRTMDAPGDNGNITITSSHWGPHYGAQSSMLLGVGGATDGSAGAHYAAIQDGCVTCHLGEDDLHTFEPQLSACLACHADAESFDIGNVQTDVTAMMEELAAGLRDLGYLDEDNHPVRGEEASPEHAAAVWNYRHIYQDHSFGIHNPAYTKALLEASIGAL